MKYYLVEITWTKGAEKEEVGLYNYDNLDKAVSVFHTKMGGMMDRDTTQSEQLLIFDSSNSVYRSEIYTAPVEEEGTVEPETLES